MVISEGFRVFIGLKVGGSRGILPQEKFNVQDFRNVILGILANLLSITTQYSNRNKLSPEKADKLLMEFQLYLATKFLQVQFLLQGTQHSRGSPGKV